MGHYQMTTDAHFEDAVKGRGGALHKGALHKAVQQPAALSARLRMALQIPWRMPQNHLLRPAFQFNQ